KSRRQREVHRNAKARHQRRYGRVAGRRTRRGACSGIAIAFALLLLVFAAFAFAFGHAALHGFGQFVQRQWLLRIKACATGGLIDKAAPAASAFIGVDLAIAIGIETAQEIGRIESATLATAFTALAAPATLA